MRKARLYFLLSFFLLGTLYGNPSDHIVILPQKRC